MVDKPAGGETTQQRTLPRIDYIAEYARHTIRLYMHVTGRGAESAEDEQWRGFRIPSERVAAQFIRDQPELFSENVEQGKRRLQKTLSRWITDPPREMMGLAELSVLFRLTEDDVALLMMAAAPAIDPDIAELYAFVWDNVNKRNADVGFICKVLAMGDHQRFERLLQRCMYDAPLRRHRLLLVEERHSSEDTLDKNLALRRVRAADRVLEYLRQGDAVEVHAVDEALASTCVRLSGTVSFEKLPLADYARDAVLQVARAKVLRTIFNGPEGAGKQRTAQALATMRSQTLLVADLTALLTLMPHTLELRLSELFREARLGNDLLYLKGHGLPEVVPGPSAMVLARMLADEQLVLGVDKMPLWLVNQSAGWPVVNIPLPLSNHRAEMWAAAFEGDRRAPEPEAIQSIARRYELSEDQIRQAAAEAKRLALVARHRRVELGDIDKACRSHFAHQLTELADLVPPSTFTVDQLILPEKEKEKFDEVILFSQQQETIYGEWGFGEKFPYGRGLSVLFYGPPGTGKTMGALIIANILGLDLFRVDLSRIMSRYVGETEKNLAKVFDEAEKGRAMLLFDEADALFTKRTQVKSSVDRYANLEVAYLLQRMEQFEGVTVLTTNHEANLDDAFKRRIKYRIYFPMPDAETRGRLYKSLMPRAAPVRKDIPWDLLGEQFEITGGHIKQAVLRAAFYAKRDDSPIGLTHLVEASTVECRELGMLMSDRLPKPLERALRAEKGLPDLPDDEPREIILSERPLSEVE